ncbi:peptidase inhibitor family I36 protein [Streptomyces sp. NBC_01275]|uniref:peptidase inhibitor family I36 protein n=1 Tax=Streptomyces sp. NBC_01275 TaxID=2903807 RepID=UPI002252A84D|nr:peptidase inhibitor family I36 protein [Streptomyces sp. NBC_01275]MCX4764108.1 peptidase inhibitor family I36 protein [Streptomyces sp. NBC_01275]
MRRLTRLAAVALSAAFALGPLMAAPASAAPDAASSCPANRFCMYYNSDFSGSHNEMTSKVTPRP